MEHVDELIIQLKRLLPPGDGGWLRQACHSQADAKFYQGVGRGQEDQGRTRKDNRRTRRIAGGD
jgi:hypothetical protein